MRQIGKSKEKLVNPTYKHLQQIGKKQEIWQGTYRTIKDQTFLPINLPTSNHGKSFNKRDY